MDAAGHPERLTHPLVKTNGRFREVPWDEALAFTAQQLSAVRQSAGPDALGFLASAKCSNEENYLFQKFTRAVMGTNNVDHQARICHSTTVAGVANTWGYGAMTNSYNDIHKSRAIFLIGGNPAEAHPVSLLHMLKAKEENNAPLIVIDPRVTECARKADLHLQPRPGEDPTLIAGLIHVITREGLHDADFLSENASGFEALYDGLQKVAAPRITEALERIDAVDAGGGTNISGALDKALGMLADSSRPNYIIFMTDGLPTAGVTEEDRIKPRLLSSQIIRRIDDHHAQLINRMRHGQMIVPGQTLYVMECEPAAYAALAANEASDFSRSERVTFMMKMAWDEIFDEVKRRPLYLVGEHTDGDQSVIPPQRPVA